MSEYHCFRIIVFSVRLADAMQVNILPILGFVGVLGSSRIDSRAQVTKNRSGDTTNCNARAYISMVTGDCEVPHGARHKPRYETAFTQNGSATRETTMPLWLRVRRAYAI